MAASVAVHAAVLTVLAIHAPRLRAPPPQPSGPPEAIIPLLIMPKTPPATGEPGSRPTEIRLHRRPQRFITDLPIEPLIAPPPAEAAEKPTTTAAARGPSRPPPEPAIAVNARNALRSRLGCANAGMLGLSRAEREACEDKLGAGARQADFPGLGVDADKATGLAAAAARKERDYNYVRGGTPVGTARGNSAEDMGRIVGSDRPTAKIPF